MIMSWLKRGGKRWSCDFSSLWFRDCMSSQELVDFVHDQLKSVSRLCSYRCLSESDVIFESSFRLMCNAGNRAVCGVWESSRRMFGTTPEGTRQHDHDLGPVQETHPVLCTCQGAISVSSAYRCRDETVEDMIEDSDYGNRDYRLIDSNNSWLI